MYLGDERELSLAIEKLENERPQLKNNVNLIGGEGFQNVLHFLLDTCRSHGSFKRKLLLPFERSLLGTVRVP